MEHRPTVLEQPSMSTHTTTGQETSESSGEITGPWVEYDRDGKPTGADYYRCEGCGVESVHKGDLKDGGCNC